MTKLSHKLFIAIFLLSLVILASMVFLSKSALQTGFVKYLNETENLLLSSLKVDLEEVYQVEQSWDSVVNDRGAWWALLRKHLQREAQIKSASKTGRLNDSTRSESPSIHGGIWSGIRLLDADRTVLIGRVQASANPKELVLQVNGATVGYLSLNPTTQIQDELGLSFTRQLMQTIQYSALGVLAISILLAMWLAKDFVNPIKALVAGTRALTAGDFKQRFTVNTKDELGQLAKDFNNLAATLESNENSRRQWIADISHELRTPLTILRGELEAITDGVRQMSPKMLESLHSEILHLGALVNDLYQLSLSDVGALSYKKETIDVCQVLNEVIENYQDEFTKNKISLDFNPDTNRGL